MESNQKIIDYETQGTCTSHLTLRMDGDVIQEVTFEGGCDGNLQAICKLIVGMKARDVANQLKGIDCGGRGTSCPDQLAKALLDSP
jgi:uncharacterized protein (TIGR03905 family)